MYKILSNEENAVSTYIDGFNCSQAVLSTFGPSLGLNREIALKVSEAFGSGICQMGEICGAVIGALMAIGLKYGKTKAEDTKATEFTYNYGEEFVSEFTSRNGTIICKKLLGCDITTPEGMKLADEKNLWYTLCPKYIEDAVEILEEIL